MPEILPADCLEAVDNCRGIVVQKREDKPRDAILFKGVAAGVGQGCGQEAADARARFEQRAHRQAVLRECGAYLPRYGIHEELRRVKGREDRGLEAVRQLAIHCLFSACESSQGLLQAVHRLRHGVRQGVVRSDVQHFLDAPEAGIAGQRLLLLCHGFAALHVDFYRRFDGLHVRRQRCLFVVTHHSTLFFVPFVRSVCDPQGLFFCRQKVAGTIRQGWTEKYARRRRGRFLRITRGGSRPWRSGTAGLPSLKNNPRGAHRADGGKGEMKKGRWKDRSGRPEAV